MCSNSAALQNIDDLFPTPSLPPSHLSPQRVAGANLESLAALKDVLKDNYERYHIFFNDLHFHNHVAHRALAIYAVGGSGPIIRDYYERDGRIQRPAVPSPEPIAEHNFIDHLGDEKYYQAYLSFFVNQLSANGAANTLERFVFSKEYNFREGRNVDAQPEVLNSLLTGLLHPFIHVGYGLEFGLKGVLAEGLALTAVQGVLVREILPPSLFTVPSATDNADHVTSRLPSLALDTPTVAGHSASKIGGVHAFDIVARILKDDRFGHTLSTDFGAKFEEVFVKYSHIVREYAKEWKVDLNQRGEVERKLEELTWLSSLLYGPGGLVPGGFQADFYLMHLVTSSLFLPSLIAYLSPASQALLLRGYLQTVLTWWAIRGRPTPHIKSFLTTTSLEPSVPTTPAPGVPASTETTATPNAFLPILQSAIPHPNDHVIKIQRAFVHFNTLYGQRAAGYFEGTELADAGLLDGSLFLRAALLTADSVGWVREGQKAKPFNRQGYYQSA